jgi:hypothetical protein
MDLLDVLDEARATQAPSVDAMTSVRTRLHHEARRAQPQPGRRHLSRRWLVSIAAFASMIGAGATAWALTNDVARTNTTIECGVDTFIPVESGNPILDCHSALAAQGSPVPPLAGWITPTGLVAVLPTDVSPPSGSTPLPAGFTEDRAVLYVNDVLNDQATPIATGCTSPSDATAFAQRQLRLAGLGSWSVSVRRADGGSSAGCVAYFGYLDATNSEVVLVPAPFTGGASSNPPVRLDLLLRAQLITPETSRCLTSAQASALVADDAARVGIPDSQVAVSVAGPIGGGAECAIATIDPGGSTQVDIWDVPAASRG